MKVAEHILTGHKVAIKILNRKKIKQMDMEEKGACWQAKGRAPRACCLERETCSLCCAEQLCVKAECVAAMHLQHAEQQQFPAECSTFMSRWSHYGFHFSLT